jgi:hypothetical protein
MRLRAYWPTEGGSAVRAALLVLVAGGAIVGAAVPPACAETVSPAERIEQAGVAFAERFLDEKMTAAIAAYEAALPNLDDLAVQSQAFVLNRLSQLYYERTTFSPGDTSDDREAFEKGVDYGLQSLRLCPGFAEWEIADLQHAVSFVSDPAALLWTADNWGGLCGLNPIQGMLDLGKVRALYERCVAVDETYWGASAHNALGAMLIVTPEMLGGDSEAGRDHLEKAVALAPEYLLNRVVHAQYWGFTYDFFGNLTGVRDPDFIEDQLRIVLADPIGDWPFWNREAKKEAEDLLEQLREL